MFHWNEMLTWWLPGCNIVLSVTYTEHNIIPCLLFYAKRYNRIVNLKSEFWYGGPISRIHNNNIIKHIPRILSRIFISWYLYELYVPVQEILVLIAYAQSLFFNIHAQLARGARCLNFGLRLPLLPYLVCARSKGSDETAHMRSLVWVFDARQNDTYQNLVCWHIIKYDIGI